MFIPIITDYDPKPIPTRQFDWTAVYADDLGERFVGYGETDHASRVDLLVEHPREESADV